MSMHTAPKVERQGLEYLRQLKQVEFATTNDGHWRDTRTEGLVSLSVYAQNTSQCAMKHETEQ